jgi:hypothetical protein
VTARAAVALVDDVDRAAGGKTRKTLKLVEVSIKQVARSGIGPTAGVVPSLSPRATVSAQEFVAEEAKARSPLAVIRHARRRMLMPDR